MNLTTEGTEKIGEREIRNPKHPELNETNSFNRESEVRNNDQNTNAPMMKTSYFQHLSLGHFVI